MSEARNDDDEAEIRAEAHRLWVAEGRPDGRADWHWAEAKEIVALRNGGLASTLKPLDETLSDPVEQPFVAENNGDVPGPFVDTGEARPAPSLEAAREIADEEPLSVAPDAASPKKKRWGAKRR